VATRQKAQRLPLNRGVRYQCVLITSILLAVGRIQQPLIHNSRCAIGGLRDNTEHNPVGFVPFPRPRAVKYTVGPFNFRGMQWWFYPEVSVGMQRQNPTVSEVHLVHALLE